MQLLNRTNEVFYPLMAVQIVVLSWSVYLKNTGSANNYAWGHHMVQCELSSIGPCDGLSSIWKQAITYTYF